MNVGVINNNKLIIISTPSISGNRVPDIYDMANIFIPADIFKRFSELNKTSVMILSSMNIFTHATALDSVRFNKSPDIIAAHNYINSRVVFSDMNISVNNFYKNNRTDFAYYVEFMYAYLKKNGWVNNGRLDRDKMKSVLEKYYESVGKHPLNLFNDLADKTFSLIKTNMDLTSDNKIDKDGIETNFQKGLFYDHKLIEALMSSASLKDAYVQGLISEENRINILTDAFSNYAYTTKNTFIKDAFISPAIVFGSAQKEMIPTNYIVSSGLAGSNISLDEYFDHLKVPFASDILRITLIANYPYPNAYHFKARHILNMANNIKKSMINIILRANNLIARAHDGQTRPLSPAIEIKFSQNAEKDLSISALDYYYTVSEMFTSYVRQMNMHRYSSGWTKTLSVFCNIRTMYELNEPWETLNSETSDTVLALTVNMTVIGCSMLYPFAPNLAKALMKVLGYKRVLKFEEIQSSFSKEEPLVRNNHLHVEDTETLAAFENFNFDNSVYDFQKQTNKKI